MDPASLLFAAALVVLVAAFLAQPIVRRQGASALEPEALSALRIEQDRLLGQIEELDHDHAMGKLDPQAYDRQRTEWVALAAGVTREIDELERAGHARRTASGKACAACGWKTAEGDRFCSRCGASLPADIE